MDGHGHGEKQTGKPRWLVPRLTVWWEVLWSPARAVLVAVYAILQFLSWLRGELPSERSEAWRLTNLIPELPWWGWAVGWLGLGLGLALEGAHRAVAKREQKIMDLHKRVERLEADTVTDADVAAVQREIAERLNDRGTAEQVQAVQRRSQVYDLFQNDAGTKPWSVEKVLSLPDPEKARMKKKYPHLWQWFLDSV